jgi:hypothetical protein
MPKSEGYTFDNASMSCNEDKDTLDILVPDGTDVEAYFQDLGFPPSGTSLCVNIIYS